MPNSKLKANKGHKMQLYVNIVKTLAWAFTLREWDEMHFKGDTLTFANLQNFVILCSCYSQSVILFFIYSNTREIFGDRFGLNLSFPHLSIIKPIVS